MYNIHMTHSVPVMYVLLAQENKAAAFPRAPLATGNAGGILIFGADAEPRPRPSWPFPELGSLRVSGFCFLGNSSPTHRQKEP